MRKCFGLVCSLLFAVAGCDDSPPVTGPDPGPGPSIPGFYTLQKLSGDGQTGNPSLPLADPYVVKVVDFAGGAVPGATVKFAIQGGVGGSLTSSSVVTDSAGDAKVTARLPDDPNAVQTVLVVMDSATNFLTFTSSSTLSAAGASSIRIISGNGQKGPTQESLLDTLVVEVSNTDGIALAGVSVKWKVVSLNGGSVRENPTLTDGQGLAENSWRLGGLPGATDQVIAWIEPANAPPDTVTFTAQVTEGPASIRIVSGNAQTGASRDTLLFPLVVEVTDIDGVTLENASVHWKVVSTAGGSVRESPTSTNSQGLASNSWRLGDEPGVVDTLIAWIEPSTADPDTVMFTADVTAGASNLRIVSGDDQKGIERDTLLDPLVVEVRDAEGVALEGVSVKWRVTSSNSGTVRETPTVTDDQGLAYNRWRIGNEPGAADTVIAWIEPVFADPDTVTFTAEVTGVPDTIVIIQGAVELDHDFNMPEFVFGDTVLVAWGFWARQAFKGIVRDSDGREVRGAILTWTVTDTGGQVGLEPEDGAGEEAVTLNTAEDGAITVWRKAGGSCRVEFGPKCEGWWLGATLSIDKYPDVTPVTLDALVRN